MQVQRLMPGIVEATRLAPTVKGIVSDIDPAAPAAEAGVRLGDMLIRGTEFDPLDPGSILFAVATLEPGRRSALLF